MELKVSGMTVMLDLVENERSGIGFLLFWNL